jgi:hypothetical protein
MINVKNIAQQILTAKPMPEPEIVKPEVAPKKVLVTSIPQDQIDDALEIANFVREKSDSLLSEANLAIENLSGESKASVLESKDDFKSLLLRLKQMKRKLSVV